jgi:hypothetical protein
MPDVADDIDEHPIIFNDWSIRRILAGEKTQTRRLTGLDEINESPFEWQSGEMMSFDMVDSKARFGRVDKYGMTTQVEVDCPYGQPGDVLWVREAFRLPAEHSELSPSEYIKNRNLRSRAYDAKYIADGAERQDPHPDYPIDWGRKRPSIHMPKELCRLRLRVEDVRVERVQEISGEDAQAEGITGEDADEHDSRHRSPGEVYRLTFRDLWNDIHGDGAWDENPWVWVLEFSRINE